MRYLVGFLRACGLILIAFIGCYDSESEGCDIYEDKCEGVVCPDDGNECTDEYCSGGNCYSRPTENGTACTYDGLAGVCVEGVCGENLCADVVCDDNDACTEDFCDYVDASCYFEPVQCEDGRTCTDDSCDPVDGCVFAPVEDGTYCVPDIEFQVGLCEAGVCIVPTDACLGAEDLALVCDPSFDAEVEACGRANPTTGTGACLVENTGVSPECAVCYEAVVRCVFFNCMHVCGPEPSSQACEDCQVEADCIDMLDDCTGDLGSDCSVGAMKLNLGAHEVEAQ